MKQGKTFNDNLYCTSPFNSLFLRPNGDVASCCAATDRWGNIHDDDIENIVNSENAKQIRKKILVGKNVSYCDWCYKTEKTGCSSQRQAFELYDVDLNKEFELKSLDIRWSTICNFSCIYCDEMWSSMWAKKKNLPIDNENLQKIDSVLNFIEKQSQTIENVMVAGGEPLLQVQNEKLFDILKEDTKVLLITNLGVDLSKSKIYNRLKNMPNVDWAVSFENVKQHFEYVRHGGNWERMCSNLKELQTNETHYVVIKAIIHTLCLLRIDDLFDFAEDMNIDIEWQLIVDEDDFMNPFNLSGNVRNIMIDKLEYVLSKKWKFSYDRNFIENTLDRLKNENPLGDVDLMKDKISKFIQHNEKKYNETLYKFEELWPELI